MKTVTAYLEIYYYGNEYPVRKIFTFDVKERYTKDVIEGIAMKRVPIKLLIGAQSVEILKIS